MTLSPNDPQAPLTSAFMHSESAKDTRQMWSSPCPALRIPLTGLRKLWLALLVVSILAFCMYAAMTQWSIAKRIQYSFSGRPLGKVAYTVWPEFTITQKLSQEWYQRNCFIGGRFQPGIENLMENLDRWRIASEPACRNIYTKLTSVYSIEKRNSPTFLPAEYVPKMVRWLGGNHSLLSAVRHQYVIHVFNEFTQQHTIHSPIRALRMRPPSPDYDGGLSYVRDLLNRTAASCDFCNYEKSTARDSFGRLESNFSVTAANSFKLDHWHSLVVPYKHDPMNLTLDEVIDMFSLAKRWFSQVYEMEPQYKYPNLLWDTFPHGGASQVHPHFQLMLDPDRYYGQMESLRRGAQFYNEHFPDSNYFSDLVTFYTVLGLTVTYGKAVALVELTGRKDYEIVLLSPKPNQDLFSLYYFVIQMFYTEAKQYCYSSGMVFPALEPTGTTGRVGGNLPAMIRIVPRGDVSTVFSEISSLELFLANNVNYNPYKVISALMRTIARFSTSSSLSPAVPDTQQVVI